MKTIKATKLRGLIFQRVDEVLLIESFTNTKAKQTVT